MIYRVAYIYIIIYTLPYPTLPLPSSALPIAINPPFHINPYLLLPM